ncbi:MAG TPA: hypothetical protein VH558_08755 [Pseudolabrys sp.]|jgi:CheY-like chemotaxis protein
MFQTEWPVLLVDDDSDVLAVSKLAMKNFVIDGVPIKLFTASSKAEAIELLNGPLNGSPLPYVSVAFIDVVMETNHAGLELCQHIRETLLNRLTQIYIRTGQPGLAPERDVIDRYDINGYFAKSEMSEDKLYSLVKAGIRQFDSASMAILEFDVIGRAMAASNSIQDIQQAIGQVLGHIAIGPPGSNRANGYEIKVGLFEGDRLLGGNYSEPDALAERNRLIGLGLQPLNPNGDAYAQDGHSHLVKAAATDKHGDVWHLGRFPSTPSPADTVVLLNFTKVLASICRLAAHTH